MNKTKGSTGDFEYINEPESLRSFCDDIKGQQWLAVDTEFIRERTYFPDLCLIQIGVPGRSVCIDPLAIEDLTPLYDILYDRSVLKIFHACSQDLEIFVTLKGEVPGPVFDTQMTAPLLGLQDQMGYGNFVKARLGFEIEKAHSRADWAHRPLSQDQLQYAADDVRYLIDLYPALIEELQKSGRLEWLTEEFKQLELASKYQRSPEDAWLRIRGFDKFKAGKLSILQLLAAWREKTAIKKNLPRNWVIKDEIIIDIARMAPDNVHRLEPIRNLQSRTIQQYGAEWIALVEEGLSRQPDPVPAGHDKRKKATLQEDVLADLMQSQLRLLASQKGINSSILASRKDLLAVARGEQNVPVLCGWRLEVAGRELIAMRDGNRTVSVQNGKVIITDN